MTIQNIMKDTRTAMDKALEAAKREFSTIHAGKAHDDVRLLGYGGVLPLPRRG